MTTPQCVMLSAAPFTGRRVHAPHAIATRPLPRLRPLSVRRRERRARAAAPEPEAGTAPEAEKSVDVLEGTAACEPESPKNAAPESVSRSASASDEPVPGKIVLDELALAAQPRELDQYAAELHRKRLEEEREASRLFGFVPYAETLNGGLAMIFLVTGLLTEYWTGYKIPEQVELMARTLGML